MTVFKSALRWYLPLSVLYLTASEELDDPVVQTKLGSLKGQYVEVKGKEKLVHAYLGVPFAKPPVGPLRLAPPQPTDGWEGLRDATKQPFMCIQNRQLSIVLAAALSLEMEIPDVSEDCLYLNIYVPAKASEKAKLPVMFWIHGGGYVMGAASMYDGSVLAAYEDVVVVAVQYRLGLLGFLSTGDHHIPGNMGLMDQVEGLRWVQEHIHNFGGDPGAVTIFGESAGGVSVSLLLLSPMSTGLFHRAIAESGTAAMNDLLTIDPVLMAKTAANSSGCDITSTKNIAECMRVVGEEDILTLAKDQTLQFIVTVDGHFLPKPVEELYQNQQLHKVPFMTGMTSDEGGWLLPGFLAPPNWTEGMDRGEVLPFLSMIFPDPKDHWITELVADEYLGTSGDRVKIRNGFTQLIGDFMFTVPALRTANAHKDAGAAVYLYEYRYIPTFIADTRPSFVGSDHGEDLYTVFGLCFTTTHVKLSSPCTKEDEHLCKTMMGYWGNFARTGDPNGAGLSQWPQYGSEGDYLGIGLEQVAGQHLRRERFIFHTQTLPEKIRQSKEKMSKESPVVQTKLGSLRGQYVEVKGKEMLVHAYLGVPFAKPPVGPLRLAPPQPTDGWEGLRDATKQPFMCLQDKDVMVNLISKMSSMTMEFPEISEDCLYLNIYTPAKPAQDAKLPVMVWIHGGGFSMGSASMFDGSTLAAYQDVVVVLVQYRLGLLGFLSTGDHHIPGNMGLMDQLEGLRWVQEHIHNFGGDPGAVTIFGESAGGMSVSLLLLSPMSNGLFHGAIAQSGTAAMAGLQYSNPLPMAKMAANSSGCDITSTEKIAECMKVLGKEALLTIAEDRMMRFLVTVDGHFLIKPVEELFQSQQVHKVPFMTGINSDEGGFILIHLFLDPPNWTEGMGREEVLALQSLLFLDPKDHWITQLVADEYRGTSGDRVKIRNGFTQLIGDFMFVIPVIKTADAHRDAGVSVYVYELQEPPTILTKLRPNFVGVDHADDLIYVFGVCFVKGMEGRCMEEDERISLTMMKYWGNFAHTGDPNGAGLSQWPQYGAEGDYLGIGLEQVAGQHLRRERLIFLTQTLPEKIRQSKEEKEHSEL